MSAALKDIDDIAEILVLQYQYRSDISAKAILTHLYRMTVTSQSCLHGGT